MFRCTDRPAMTIAVDLGRKATKQTNKQKLFQTKEGSISALRIKVSMAVELSLLSGPVVVRYCT